jgi:glycosyltransferase involved in cell wall biosynthesis
VSAATLHLVFPGSRGEISGGHIYNERLAQGLAAHGEPSQLSIDELEGELRRGTPGFYVLDSLDLERVEQLPPRSPDQKLALIAHHLPSLDCFGAEAATARATAAARESALLARFDLVVATGTYAADYLRALGAATDRIVLVPPAPPPRPTAAERPALPPINALLVANVIPRKGVLELLEALNVDLRAEQTFELTIVGRLDLDAAYAERCAAFVAATPLARVVRLVGAAPPNEVGDYYARSHVLVSPSRMETFGMALQEARSFGVPILALETGNVPEHVSAGNGRLFATIPSIAQALLGLVDTPAELVQLLALAESARATEHYDWAAAARLLLDGCERLTRS